MSAVVDFNDTHKCHETLVVKVGAHAKVLTVTGKVVPLVNINAILLVSHNLRGQWCAHTLEACVQDTTSTTMLSTLNCTICCMYIHLVQKAHFFWSADIRPHPLEDEKNQHKSGVPRTCDGCSEGCRDYPSIPAPG